MADFDLVVLGTGPAGEKGAAQAAYFKKRVAVIESAPEPGGAAVHTGTLPSKTLRETSLYLSGYRQRELYGISVTLDRANAAPRLLSRKDAIRQADVDRIRHNLEGRHHVTTLTGQARLADGHTVEVVGNGTTTRVTGDVILIATGSVPHRPADIDFSDPDIDDSDTVLRLDRLPTVLTVLGAGVIGCEYATMFAALGVRVRLVDPRERIMPFVDKEICDKLVDGMHRLGVETFLGDPWIKESAVRRMPGRGIVTRLESGREIEADQLLFAAGRSGRTRDLGLEAVGVKLDKRAYIQVNETTYHTGVEQIYAAGDCIGFPALASTAMEQGRVAVCHAFAFPFKRKLGEHLPYGIYTIPEVSCVGVDEAGAREHGQIPVVGRAEYSENARGQIVGDRDGMIKLVFDAGSRKLIGCHCIGERATELVHIGQAIMTLDGTVETLIEMVFNYPTLSELYKYAAYDALGRWGEAAGGQSRG